MKTSTAAWLIGLAALAVVAAVLFIVPFPVHAQVQSFTLTWTSPGDDNGIGTAATYEMRWSATRPDTTSGTAMNTWWQAATPVVGLPNPQIAGTTQTANAAPTSGFLTGVNYYFVIKACDDAVPANCSPYSNVAVKFQADTLPPRRIIDLR